MQSPHSRYAESSCFPVGMSDPRRGDRAGTSNKLPVTQATQKVSQLNKEIIDFFLIEQISL